LKEDTIYHADQTQYTCQYLFQDSSLMVYLITVVCGNNQMKIQRTILSYQFQQ